MKSFHLAPNKYSFRLIKEDKSIKKEISDTAKTEEPVNDIKDKETSGVIQVEKPVDSIKDKETSGVTQVEEPVNNIKDLDKRIFLKGLGIAGLGVVAAILFPKKADALILGGTPTSSVVGVKNVANTRVNPATEETAATLLKTSDLTFDTGSLQVKVTSLPPNSFSDSGNVAKSGLVDSDRHLQVDVLSSALPITASTETTLQTISFGGFKFSLRLATVGSVDYMGEATVGAVTSSAVWRVKKIDSTTGISITWAGTGTFNQIWDNYASLTYT